MLRKNYTFYESNKYPHTARLAEILCKRTGMSGVFFANGGGEANEKCRNVLGPGTHATTFGANPVCAAAGLLVQETLTDDFLAEVQAKGDYLRKAIEALNLPCFGKTRGMGLMIGIEVRDGYDKGKILSRLIENGLLVLTAGPGMRLLPPLTHYKGGAGSGAGNHEEGIGELLTRQVSFLRFSKRVRRKFCEHAFYPPSAGDAAGQSRKKRKIFRSLKRNRVETRHII